MSIPSYTLASLLFLAGCGHKEELKVLDLTDYLDPLHVGLKREYLVELAKPGEPFQRGRAVYEVDGKETFHGKEYHRQTITSTGIPNVPTIIQYERVSEAGRFVIHGDDASRTEHLQLPLPLNIGDTWTTSPSTGGQETYHADGLETIIVSGKTYENCLKISHTSAKSNGYTYLARGIGGVKIHHDFNNAVLNFTLEHPGKVEQAP